jgi:hypothetical protein
LGAGVSVGVGVTVGVAVAVGVEVGVEVSVEVGVEANVAVGLGVQVGVDVGKTTVAVARATPSVVCISPAVAASGVGVGGASAHPARTASAIAATHSRTSRRRLY